MVNYPTFFIPELSFNPQAFFGTAEQQPHRNGETVLNCGQSFLDRLVNIAGPEIKFGGASVARLSRKQYAKLLKNPDPSLVVLDPITLLAFLYYATAVEGGVSELDCVWSEILHQHMVGGNGDYIPFQMEGSDTVESVLISARWRWRIGIKPGLTRSQIRKQGSWIKYVFVLVNYDA